MEKIQRIGVDAYLWARRLLEERGHQGIRVLYGLLSLTRKNDANQINAASRMALEAGMYHFSPLRKLMAEVKKPETAFTSEHEIIRPLTEYQLFHPVSAADKESS